MNESSAGKELREYEKSRSWARSRRECWKRGIYAHGNGRFETRKDLVEGIISRSIASPEMQKGLREFLAEKTVLSTDSPK